MHIPPEIWGPMFWATFHITSLAYPDAPTYTEKRAAKEFFNANPEVTPAHLLEVMNFCAAYVANNPLEDGEYDENYDLRKGTQLTSLLKSLPAVVAAAGLGQSMPAFTGLNKAMDEE